MLINLRQLKVNTKLRTLTEAMNGADVFLGLSAKDVVNLKTW